MYVGNINHFFECALAKSIALPANDSTSSETRAPAVRDHAPFEVGKVISAHADAEAEFGETGTTPSGG